MGKSASLSPGVSDRRLVVNHLRWRIVKRQWLRLTLVAVLASLAAGCGGTSLESKVSGHVGEKVRDCRAVGIVPLGKLYSCQTDRSTVCVMVDGDDVFNASEQARQAGIAC
jgi:hypothetical protein